MIKFATDRGTKPLQIKTQIHNYHLWLVNPEDKQAYEEIRNKRTVPLFAGFDGKTTGQNLPDREIIIETAHVFGNQWNTAPDEQSSKGFRVFNWHESIQHNPRIKTGYYLDITPEMIELCETTFKCGYCGTEYYGKQNAGLFCSACLDSEYLEEKNFPLLRLMPVNINGKFPHYPELTPDELAEFMPVFIERQTTGETSRNAQKLKKQRERIENDYQKDVKNAQTEHDGLLWLMDRNISIDNAIYYNHTGRFCFGWRSPLNAEVKAKMQELLEDFPYFYDMK